MAMSSAKSINNDVDIPANLPDQSESYDTHGGFVDSDSGEEVTLMAQEGGPTLEYGLPSDISCRQNFADCSNVFKAFIGSAMIGLPFATLQAGVGFALIGVLIISFLTDHCCALIVKCKRIVIENMVEAKRAQGIDETFIRKEASRLGRDLSFGKIGKASLGTPGVLLINTSLMVTQFGFTIGYFIFLGNTMRSIIKYYFLVDVNNKTTVAPTTLDSEMFSPFVDNVSWLNTTVGTGVNSAHFFGLNGSVLQYLNDKLTASVTTHLLNSSAGFALFLALPLPLLILIAFVRNLRKLGPASVIANASITFAFAATATFIIVQMKALPDPILWFKISTFPIFFGQVTSAFEGIGTVIPIEGSMAENRGKYPAFLHVSVAGLATILASFGIIGYLAFGEKTCQIITANIQGPIAIALQIMLFIGVLFTYPLQIYPVIQITEHIIIKYRMWRHSSKIKFEPLRSESDDEEGDTLLDQVEQYTSSNMKLKKWESNIIRTLLVTFTAVVALVFRFQFAYICALTGSIGSSLLSYIIPALIHMRLTRNRWWVRMKDICLVVFGVIGGICGVTITMMELIESFNGTLPAHC